MMKAGSYIKVCWWIDKAMNLVGLYPKHYGAAPKSSGVVRHANGVWGREAASPPQWIESLGRSGT